MFERVSRKLLPSSLLVWKHSQVLFDFKEKSVGLLPLSPLNFSN